MVRAGMAAATGCLVLRGPQRGAAANPEAKARGANPMCVPLLRRGFVNGAAARPAHTLTVSTAPQKPNDCMSWNGCVEPRLSDRLDGGV
jgi:hypothetical protein